MAAGNTITPIPIVPKSITEFWSETEKLMDRIRERAYEIFEMRGREDGHALDDWFQAEMESLRHVPVVIENKPENLMLRAEAPGLDAKEIKINLLPGKIVIKGDHHEEAAKKGLQGKEQRNYSIYTEVLLPEDVIPEKATATLKNGILELMAPKAKPAVQIPVSVA